MNPAVPDRQLWAIGMIVVQWSMTEWSIDVQTRKLIGDDKAILTEYMKLRNFQQRLEFWKAQIELKCDEPVRSQLLSIIPRAQNLSPQRDEVVHRLWGGGMEGASWAANGLETTDGGMLPKPGTPIKSKGPYIPYSWGATFQRLRRMAVEMADLNRDLLMITTLGGVAASGPSHSA
jgi:hypothetical protein